MCSHTENLFKLGIKTYLSSQDLKADVKLILSQHYENLNLYKKRIEKIFQVIKNFYTIKQKYSSSNNDHISSSSSSSSSSNSSCDGKFSLNYVTCQECMTEHCPSHSISPRHHICLNCLYIGCFNFSNFSHTQAHFKKTDHAISIDMVYGSVYCFHCQDYQYDEKIEEIISDFLRNENFFLGGNLTLSQLHYLTY